MNAGPRNETPRVRPYGPGGFCRHAGARGPSPSGNNCWTPDPTSREQTFKHSLDLGPLVAASIEPGPFSGSFGTGRPAAASVLVPFLSLREGGP